MEIEPPADNRGWLRCLNLRFSLFYKQTQKFTFAKFLLQVTSILGKAIMSLYYPLTVIDKIRRQKVEQRPVFHILRDQPELNPGSSILVISGDEA